MPNQGDTNELVNENVVCRCVCMDVPRGVPCSDPRSRRPTRGRRERSYAAFPGLISSRDS